ncbi:MAG: leucine-rich repeat domain-containing protein [Holosporaceae bacterium]|jgi:hypothetical protein|nr:leucine-rich repeat domain-containing protein [Holosporaceae bacterium]
MPPETLRLVIPRTVWFLRCFHLSSQTSFESDSELFKIGSEAFAEGYRPGSITLPCNLRILDSKAFARYSGLRQVLFEPGSKLVRIESEAFFGSYSLRSIEIPCSVKILGSDVFKCCLGLRRVLFESGSKLREMGSNCFVKTDDRFVAPKVQFIAPKVRIVTSEEPVRDLISRTQGDTVTLSSSLSK